MHPAHVQVCLALMRCRSLYNTIESMDRAKRDLMCLVLRYITIYYYILL